MLRLAAFVGEHRQTGCTITDIAENVPGYDQDRVALEKMLGRDLKELAKSVGIVITWSDDRQRYLLEPPLFTARERQALLTAAGVVDVDGIGTDLPPGELGTAVSADLAKVVVRVHHLVTTLRDAITDRCRICFEYHGTNGSVGRRTIDPYAVGLWRTRWYVVGHDHAWGERRAFRLDRIIERDGEPSITIESGPGSYEIPPGFDLASALKMDPNAWGTDPPLVASVRVRRDHVPAFLAEFTGTVERTNDTDTIISVEVRDYTSFVIRLLGFGTSVRLLSPPELCDCLHEWVSTQVGA